MVQTANAMDSLFRLAEAVGHAGSLEEIYRAALDCLRRAIGVERASVLLVDGNGVMRFAGWCGLSDDYRRAVEGHSPWSPDASAPEPIVVPDVSKDSALQTFAGVFEREGIAGLAFIPLVAGQRLIGKFMLYFESPRGLNTEETRVALTIAHGIAFAVERTRSEAELRESERRLRFALEAADMGIWDWDIETGRVQWSENLERVHGLPPGSFDGTFQSYEREIHPEDRERVLASIGRAIREGLPHDVEYRIVAPDGTVRWVEGKGCVVANAEGRPTRMSGVCRNITDRKRAEIDRMRLYEEAQTANGLKDEFLSTLSHELRTPLSAILGWSHLLETGQVPDPRIPDAIATIQRNARVQVTLIDDLLDVARIGSGKLTLALETVDALDVLRSELQTIGPVAGKKQVAMDAQIEGVGPVRVRADPRRLRQIFWNLLSNAVKFSNGGGRVTVRAAVHENEWRLSVQDSGVGIEPWFLPHIFDRFRQADGTLTRSHSGLGLGLSITRQLVELHGGAITAASEGRGRGATFEVRVPLAVEAALPVAEAIPNTDAPAGELLLPAGVHVLVVDDDEDSRELIRALLEPRGARVCEADSVGQARECLEREPFDALIADIAMPGVDGYTFIRELRSVPALRGIPAIAVTASARSVDRQRALHAGYDSFHPKPVDPPLLLAAIRRLLAQRHAVRGAARTFTSPP